MFILEGMFTLIKSKTCTELESVIAIVKFILTIVQWVVPIILIVLGTIDLVKAVTQGKEEEIKKGQKILIQRIIAAVIVFLVPLIVSIIMGWLGSSDWKTCWKEVDPGINLGI